MSVKRVLIMWMVLAVVFSPTSECYAEETGTLAQVYAWEKNMDIYITGNLDSDHLSCKISNQSAEIMDSGLLTDKNVTIRTTVLVDISKSIPSAMRKKIRLYLNTIIRDIGENEQYKIVTFSDDAKVLQDFTKDRYDLSEAVEQIKFNGKESRIFDAIYNTIPKLEPLEGQAPCYYRTLLITDGNDHTASGVTKEELYLKLQADVYPIDIVAVSENVQETEEKELSALARISSGKYVNLHTESEASEIAKETFVGDIFWLRIVIPGTLLDGSTRQTDISDGMVSVPFDVKIPVFDIPMEEEIPVSEEKNNEEANKEETNKEEANKEETNKEEAITPTESSPAPSPTAADDSLEAANLNSFPYLYILLLVGLVLCILIIVILLISKRKKTEKVNEHREHSGKQENDSPTVVLGSTDSGNMDGKTENRKFIRLRNMENPDQIWNLPLSGNIMIGRDEGSQVHLKDKSVSRQQCRIYQADGAVMVENKSKTNVTKLNGNYLENPSQVREQDQLKCGSVMIMIDSIYYTNTGGTNKLSKETKYVNV